MNRRNFIPVVVLCLFLCGAAGLQAQIVTYTWTGQGMDNSWYNNANWNVSPAPDDVLTANATFGDSPKNYVNLYNNSPASPAINIHGLTIAGNTRPYYLDGDYDGYLTMTIGTGGITYSPAQPVHSVIAADFEFSGNQTWNITSGTLVLDGYLYDGDSGYMFTKTGAGTLVLGNYYNAFDSATINHNNGRLVLSSFSGYQPLGSADLIIGSATLGNNPIIVVRDDYYNESVALNNNITLNGALTTENDSELQLLGSITLNTDTTIKSTGNWLVIDGAIANGPTASPAARKLTVDSTGAVILGGINTYSGGTHVQNGVLVFATVDSLPASPATNAISSSATGYVGFGDDGTTNGFASLTNPQGLFIDRFNKALTFGTIGFDTDPDLAATNYTGAINLTGFATSARLGSATHAVLSGTITPQGTAYRFGGGGGLLQVDSTLTGARSLAVDSPAATPLTLRLHNPVNDYTGGTSVTNSALIFGTGLAAGIPAGTRNITINAGGYVGFEFVDDIGDATFVLNSLAKITTTSIGTVGYDNYSLLTVPIDLSLFTNALYLGTSTKGVSGPGLTISGLITPAGGASAPYRFAGYKGGALKVESTLTGSRAVHIGDPSSPATFGDYISETYSTVALTGNNSGLTGPVMLYGGQLVVGQHATDGTVGTTPTHALGSGTLEVVGMTLPPEWQAGDDEAPAPRFGAIASSLIVPNNINLSTDLYVGGENSFTLAGNITGAGELYVGEDSAGGFTLGLSGNNTFSGGVYVASGAIINAGSNTALGTGPVGFGYSGGTINFQTAAPVIGSLMTKEENDYAYLTAAAPNTLLTINQTADGKFRGTFQSTDVSGAVRVIKNGANTLRLDYGSLGYAHGVVNTDLSGAEIGLQVNQGTLVLGNSFSFGSYTPTVWVHGGTLALDRAYLSNPLVIDNGGRLAGTGWLNAATIGTGATIAPGSAMGGQLGFLEFSNHLTLASGGTYEWNLAHHGEFVSDHVNVGSVTTLEITATSANKFTLRAVTLGTDGNPGILAGAIGPNTTYSWMLMSALSITPNGGTFDPNAFTLDVSQFRTDVGTGLALGTFSVSLASENTQLMLNLTTFAGIPEPSTYALLALGLGFLGLTAWRKRRAS